MSPASSRWSPASCAKGSASWRSRQGDFLVASKAGKNGEKTVTSYEKSIEIMDFIDLIMKIDI